MAYTKQTWNTGETITADKLNHMEDGIASSGGCDTDTFKITGIINQQTGERSLNKTYSEIVEALESGKLAYIEDGSYNRFYFSNRAIAGDGSYEVLNFNFVDTSDIASGTMNLGLLKVFNNNTVTMAAASVSVTPVN